MARTGENIYKRKDGRWEGRYIKGYSSVGGAIYGYCYASTYRAVKELCAKHRSTDIYREADRVPPQMETFGYYCREWMQQKRHEVKESTFDKYHAIAKNHLLPAFESIRITRFNNMMVEELSNDLIKRRHMAAKSVRDILAVFRAVMHYAEMHSPAIIRRPDIIAPKCERKEVSVLTDVQERTLVNYLFKEMTTVKFGVLLALMTGMRIGELSALRWRDVDVANRIIHVSGTMQRIRDYSAEPSEPRTRVVITSPKSVHSYRCIPMNNMVLALCGEWESNDPNAYVLTGTEMYMEPRMLQYWFRKFTRECHLQEVHFHTLRHTFATRCVESGFEIKSLSEILGHANPNITLARYVHSSMNMKRENMEKLPRIDRMAMKDNFKDLVF